MDNVEFLKRINREYDDRRLIRESKVANLRYMLRVSGFSREEIKKITAKVK